MAVTEITPAVSGPAREGDLIADRYLYLDPTRQQVVEERDPSRRFLLIAPGQLLRHEAAAQYGIRSESGRLVWGEPAAPEAKPETAEKPKPEAPPEKRVNDPADPQDDEQQPVRCTATTKSGKPCGAWALEGSDRCRMHAENNG